MSTASARTAWRRIPIDVVALAAIAAVVVASHLPYLGRGWCFNDPSYYFHFGRRALAGDVPYRDYVFAQGPLPIYVDALFQSVFGERFVASLYAALGVKIVRVFVIWMIARRVAGWPAAAALAVFCAFDPTFSFGHHWSIAYVQLFTTLAVLFVVLAARAEGRRALVHLALAGASAALVMSARPGSVAVIGLLWIVTTAVLLARREELTPRRFVALWGGFAAGLLLVFGVLAMAGALGPALQQMFVDAKQKTVVRGLDRLWEGISGGAMLEAGEVTWRGLAVFIALPAAIVASALYMAARDRAISRGALAMLAVPVGLLIAMLTRVASLDLLADLPRTFLVAAVVLAVVKPARVRAWLGVDALFVVTVGALALGSDAALEASFPGRGWGDVAAVVTAVILVALASAHIPGRIKTGLCAALAVAAIAHVGVQRDAGFDPFAKLEATDGPWRTSSRHVRARGELHPLGRGVRVPAWRLAAIEALAWKVTPGSTCFVHGNLPALYDLLGCTNPTRLDSTSVEIPSRRDAEAAVAALRARPPDFIIAHGRTWMSPPLDRALAARADQYDSWNPRAAMTLHQGLRALLPQYELVGDVATLIGPEHAANAAKHWDGIDAITVYRRR